MVVSLYVNIIVYKIEHIVSNLNLPYFLRCDMATAEIEMILWERDSVTPARMYAIDGAYRIFLLQL